MGACGGCGAEASWARRAREADACALAFAEGRALRGGGAVEDAEAGAELLLLLDEDEEVEAARRARGSECERRGAERKRSARAEPLSKWRCIAGRCTRWSMRTAAALILAQ
jgi:single-stranded DNA-specific DHH superfamily exonuclease